MRFIGAHVYCVARPESALSNGEYCPMDDWTECHAAIRRIISLTPINYSFSENIAGLSRVAAHVGLYMALRPNHSYYLPLYYCCCESVKLQHFDYVSVLSFSFQIPGLSYFRKILQSILNFGSILKQISNFSCINYSPEAWRIMETINGAEKRCWRIRLLLRRN